jgi:large subunit ribosomal protein L30
MPRTFVLHRTRGPKRTEPNTLTEGKVRITQVRSGIGQTARMRANLEALGLRHHQDEVVKVDSPSLRGQILRVRHLVTVAAVAGKAEKAEKAEKAVKAERKEKSRA